MPDQTPAEFLRAVAPPFGDLLSHLPYALMIAAALAVVPSWELKAQDHGTTQIEDQLGPIPDELETMKKLLDRSSRDEGHTESVAPSDEASTNSPTVESEPEKQETRTKD